MNATLEAPSATEADVTDYLHYVEAAKNYSTHTIVAYRHELAVFSAFLDEKYPAGWAWETPDRAAFREWMGDLQRKGLSKRSAARALASVRSFYTFLRNTLDRDTPNVPRRVRTPKFDSMLPGHLTLEQAKELFQIAERDAASAAGWRDRNQAIRDLAIAEVFYSTGCRLSELCDLDFKDVELTDRVFESRGWATILEGKGGDSRVVPLGTFAVRALKAWLPVREAMQEHQNKRSRALFVSLRCDRMDQRSVQRRMDKLLGRAGRPDLSVHALRHSMATHLHDAGANLRAVQAMLGHKNISMTGRYAHVAVTGLKETYMRCFPRANLDIGPYLDPVCKPDEPEAIP